MIKTRDDCELGRATLLGFGSRMSRSLLCQKLGSRLLVLLGSCGGVGNFRWQKDQRGKEVTWGVFWEPSPSVSLFSPVT